MFAQPGTLSTHDSKCSSLHIEVEVSTEVYASFLYMRIMKRYNAFHSLDDYFRELAKVFLEIKNEGNPKFADNYQRILNSNFYVDPVSSQSHVDAMQFGFQNTKLEDIPIDHSFVRQPEFMYGSKAEKVALIQRYREMLLQFEKVKELRSFLSHSIHNPDSFSKLMANMSELKTLLAEVNEKDQHVKDDGTFDRIFKIGQIYDNVVSKYVKDTFGIEGVGLNNMYQIYDPRLNGIFDNIFVARDKFVKNGLDLNEANRLAEEYCLRTQEFAKGPFKFHQLIEPHLKQSQEAIAEFHENKSVRNINFYTPFASEFRSNAAKRFAQAQEFRNHIMMGGDFKDYLNNSSPSVVHRVSDEPVRFRKHSAAGFATRGFCNKNTEEAENKSGGFTQYLKKLIQVDKSKEEDSQAKQKDLESIINKDPSDIKIGFHKIKSSITLDQDYPVISEAGDDAAVIRKENPVQESKKLEQQFLEEANQKFGIDFFKEFALSDQKLMQESFEE